MEFENAKNRVMSHMFSDIYLKWIVNRATGYRVSEREYAEWVISNLFLPNRQRSSMELYFMLRDDTHFCIDDDDLTMALFNWETSKILYEFKNVEPTTTF